MGSLPAMTKPNDETALVLERLEQRQEALIAGVGQMNETLALHSAMLQQLLEAASQEPTSDLGAVLREIAALLAEQGETMARLGVTLDKLPDRLAAAMAPAQH